MRRLRAILPLVVLSLAVFPARADAYFWAWLDELSGPQFAGVLVEVQVKCVADNVLKSDAALGELRFRIEADTLRYHNANFLKPEARAYLRTAKTYIGHALMRLEEAKATADPKRRVDFAVDAVAWKLRAAAHFAWANRLEDGGTDDPLRRPGTHEAPIDPQTSRLFPPPTIAVSLSACGYQPFDRDKRYLKVNAGLALDFKDDHEYGKNWMVTVGASYHWVAKPWLTVGTGGGVALFIPSDRPNFLRVYGQPWILDFRPAALVKHANIRSPWLHFLYIRYGGITFPQGFEAGRFTATSPEYPSWELVQTLGFHFDLSPVLRSRNSKW